MNQAATRDSNPQLSAILELLSRPQIPITAEWWSTREIASALKYNVAHVRDRLVHTPGFPPAYRAAGGKPRWRAVEVIRWMEKQKDA